MRNTLIILCVLALLASCTAGLEQSNSSTFLSGGLAVPIFPQQNSPQSNLDASGEDEALLEWEADDTRFSGAAKSQSPAAVQVRADRYTESKRRLVAKMPKISSKMRTALEGQRELLKKQDSKRRYLVGGKTLYTSDFLKVVEDLLDGRHETSAPGALSVAHRGEVKFTAYFSPELRASRTKSAKYAYPILGIPAGDRAAFPAREVIEGAKSKEFEKYALAWVEHPLDVYMLQLQGSGFVIFEDGHREYLAYGCGNGHKHTSLGNAIGKQFPEIGNFGLRAIRNWISEDLPNRAKWTKLNSNYVFFRKSLRQPTGAAGVELTAMVSVAADPDYYPLGSVLLAEVPVPGSSKRTQTRILLVQDTGSSIKGKGKLDLYTGVGSKAHEVARRTSSMGEVYMLTPR